MSASPKPPVTIALVLFAVVGWGWALSQRFSNDPDGSDADKVPVRSANASHRLDREGTGTELASVMTNPRSGQLIAHFDEILGSARPGEPNEALIKACEAALVDGNFQSRIRDIALLVEAMRPEDAPALHELFLRLHREEGRGFPMEYGTFATQWGQIDPEGALDYLAGEDPLRMPPQDVRNILRGWAEQDPGAAVQWLNDHPDQIAATGGVVSGWLAFDRDAATRYLINSDLPRGIYFDCVRSGANDILYDQGALSSVEWLSSFPDDTRSADAASSAWDWTSINYGELSYGKATELWEKVADKSWMSFNRFNRFSNGVGNARSNPDGVDGFIAALAESWPSEQAAIQFERWTREDPGAVQAWLENAPESEWVTQIRQAVGGAGR